MADEITVIDGLMRMSVEFDRCAKMIDQMKKVSLLLTDFIEEKGLKDEFDKWVTPDRVSDYCVQFLTEKR